MKSEEGRKGYKTISVSEIEAKRRSEHEPELKFACILWGYSFIES